VIDSIAASKNNSLDRLLHGLGIRMIGAQAAKVLAQNVSEIEDFFSMSAEQFAQIDTIGPAMAQSLRFYFDREENRQLIYRLREYGVNMRGISEKGDKGFLSGKTFVITGTLTTFTREAAKAQIELRGGKVTSAVSAKTDYLIKGDTPGSKFTKAEKLGVEVLDEKQFLSLLEKR
jgi:DNA ligase (NAD+)